MKEKLKNFIKKAVQFLLNPRLLLCLGLGWMITNGWSYILFAIGTWLQSGWMLAVSGAYLACLWLPISPEKMVTIAITLLRWLFPNDQKTLGVLKDMYTKLKEAVNLQRQRRKGHVNTTKNRALKEEK